MIFGGLEWQEFTDQIDKLQEAIREKKSRSEGETEMIELRVKFSDNDKHIHIFVGDEIIPKVTMDKESTRKLDVDVWVVEEKLDEGGSKVIAKGYSNYHDILGIAVGTAAGRRWERDT